jgi:hypothetical protein
MSTSTLTKHLKKMHVHTPKSGSSAPGKEANYTSDEDVLKKEDIKIEIDNDSWRNNLEDLK